MLPKFPKAYRVMKDIEREQLFEGLFSASPILRKISVHQQVEGKQMTFETDAGEIEKLEENLCRVSTTFRPDGPRGLHFEKFRKYARDFGKAFGEELLKNLFCTLDKVTNEAGMEICIEGREICGNDLLALLEKMEISFDSKGTPRLPNLVLTPKAYTEVHSKLPIWFKEEEFQLKWKDLIQRKWEAHCEREAGRRLVD